MREREGQPHTVRNRHLHGAAVRPERVGQPPCCDVVCIDVWGASPYVPVLKPAQLTSGKQLVHLVKTDHQAHQDSWSSSITEASAA